MRFLTVVCCALMAFASASAQAQAAEKKSPPTLPGECPQFNAVASFDSQKVRQSTRHKIQKSTMVC